MKARPCLQGANLSDGEQVETSGQMLLVQRREAVERRPGVYDRKEVTPRPIPLTEYIGGWGTERTFGQCHITQGRGNKEPWRRDGSVSSLQGGLGLRITLRRKRLDASVFPAPPPMLLGVNVSS